MRNHCSDPEHLTPLRGPLHLRALRVCLWRSSSRVSVPPWRAWCRPHAILEPPHMASQIQRSRAYPPLRPLCRRPYLLDEMNATFRWVGSTEGWSVYSVDLKQSGSPMRGKRELISDLCAATG